MKRQIDTIILNTLRKGRDLYLPEIGTLVVRRNAAVRNANKIEAPYREVLFTGENRGESIIDIMVRITSVTHSRAMAIYDQWLQKSLRDGVVVIGKVGSICDRKFVADESLDGTLNPSRKKRVALRPHTNTLVYVLAMLCVLIAVGAGGYMLYTGGVFGTIGEGKSASEPIVTESVEAVIPIDEQQETGVQTESVAQAEAEDVSVELKPAPSEAPTAKAQKTTSATNEYEPLPMSRGASYAVWGVYSERANAERYMRHVNSRFEDVRSRIYIYGERYMVAVYEESSRGECARLVTALKKRDAAFKDMWVYTNR